jgi:DNA-binding winged helix-turn-helix (wHTH) protein
MNTAPQPGVDHAPAKPETCRLPETEGSPDLLNAPLSSLTIGDEAKWFRIGEDLIVDLSRRRPLTRILWALAQARGGSLTATDLIEAGWPGERIVRHAARIRLRVAIATLRSMGLARHIETTRIGYALPATTEIEAPRVTESGIPLSHERMAALTETGEVPVPGEVRQVG